MISVQWNLDITNLYITIKVLDITNDFPRPSNINYIKKNLDTVEPIDITKGQETDKMYSLQSKVSLYRGSFSLTITGIRKTVFLYRGLLYVEVPYIERNLVLENTFRQSLGPSLYRGSTVVKDLTIYQAIRLRLE